MNSHYCKWFLGGCPIRNPPIAVAHVCLPKFQTSEVQVTYPSASLATIACKTLTVDEEIQSEKVVRSLRVEGSSLLA